MLLSRIRLYAELSQRSAEGNDTSSEELET